MKENIIRENFMIDGSISVKAVIDNDSREMKEIYVSERKLSDRNIRYIISKAREKNIDVKIVSDAFFLNGDFGKTNGGIAAKISERKFTDEDSLLSIKELPFIAIIEGVEDPYNFGASLRALAAAGASGLVLPKRNWMNAAATVIKSSAGASESLPTAETSDLGEFLKKAKKRGFEIIAAERKNAENLYETDFTKPIVLAVGGEKRGLSNAVLSHVTKNVFIPYGSSFRNSLGTAAATAVFAFEILRQRSGGKCGLSR